MKQNQGDIDLFVPNLIYLFKRGEEEGTPLDRAIEEATYTEIGKELTDDEREELFAQSIKIFGKPAMEVLQEDIPNIQKRIQFINMLVKCFIKEIKLNKCISEKYKNRNCYLPYLIPSQVPEVERLLMQSEETKQMIDDFFDSLKLWEEAWDDQKGDDSEEIKYPELLKNKKIETVVHDFQMKIKLCKNENDSDWTNNYKFRCRDQWKSSDLITLFYLISKSSKRLIEGTRTPLPKTSIKASKCYRNLNYSLSVKANVQLFEDLSRLISVNETKLKLQYALVFFAMTEYHPKLSEEMKDDMLCNIIVSCDDLKEGYRFINRWFEMRNLDPTITLRQHLVRSPLVELKEVKGWIKDNSEYFQELSNQVAKLLKNIEKLAEDDIKNTLQHNSVLPLYQEALMHPEYPDNEFRTQFNKLVLEIDWSMMEESFLKFQLRHKSNAIKEHLVEKILLQYIESDFQNRLLDLQQTIIRRILDWLVAGK